jgi:hypothetical protein
MKKLLLISFFLCFAVALHSQPATSWRIVVTQSHNLKITELNFITPSGELPTCNLRNNFDCSVRAICTNQEEAYKPFDGLFEGNDGLFIGELEPNSNYFTGLIFREPIFVSGLRFQKDSFNDITSFKIESSDDNRTWKLHKTFTGLSGPWTDTTFFIDKVKPKFPKNIKIISSKEILPPRGSVQRNDLLQRPKKFSVDVSVSEATDNTGVFNYQILNALTNELIKIMPFTPVNSEDKFFNVEVEKEKGLAVKIITQDIYGNTSEKLVGIGGSQQGNFRFPNILILPLP